MNPNHISVQRTELKTIKAELQDSQEPLNITSDSIYAVGK